MSVNISKSQVGAGNEQKKISLSLKQKENKSEQPQKDLTNENATNGHDKKVKDTKPAPVPSKKRDSTANSSKDSDDASKSIGVSKKDQSNDDQRPNNDNQKNESVPAPGESNENSTKKVVSAASNQKSETKSDDVVTKVVEVIEIDDDQEITPGAAISTPTTESGPADLKEDRVVNNGIEIATEPRAADDGPLPENNGTNDDEMPSLKIDNETEADIPSPSGKVLKLKSTISEDSSATRKNRKGSEKSRNTLLDGAKHPTIRTESLSSYGRISGRRSFKDLPELSLRKYNYQSYKQNNTDLDNTSSSLNVTVGSEVPNDFSFSFFGFGKKREYIETTQSHNAHSESENGITTPKRARHETNSIINLIKTPITLLRSQFSKTSMHCSTPNVDLQQSNEDGVENVSTIDTEEATTLARSAEDTEKIGEVDKELLKGGKHLDSSIEDVCEVGELCPETTCDTNRKTCNVM